MQETGKNKRKDESRENQSELAKKEGSIGVEESEHEATPETATRPCIDLSLSKKHQIRHA